MKLIVLQLSDTSYNEIKLKAKSEDYNDVGQWICHNLHQLVNKCKALTVREVQCENQAALGGYCMRHYHKKARGLKENEMS